MVSSTISSTTLDSLPNDEQDGDNAESSTVFFMKTLELYEICNHIVLSQVSVCNTFANRLGLPRLYENEDYFGIAVQLDNCLSRWEKDLPRLLRHGILEVGVDDALQRQRVMLRLRLV